MISHSKIFEMLFYFCYCCVTMSFGVILNKKLYKYVKDEEHKEKGKIVQRILKTFALVQCIGWPVIMTFGFLLKLNSELLDVIPMRFVHYSIIFLRALYTTINSYIGFNSLIIAITRYVFTVHNSIVQKIGIQKLRSIFISSSIMVPMVLAYLNESIIPVEEVWSSIFIPNYAYSVERASEKLSIDNSTTISAITRPLLAFPDHYSLDYLKCVLQVIWFFMLVITYSNLVEGFLYLRVYIYYYR